MPRRKYDWRVWLTLTSRVWGAVQPGSPGKPFWAYLWWRLKWREAANCAKKSLELNLSSEIQSLKDSKCQYPGVKRSLPCVRNKKVTVLPEHDVGEFVNMVTYHSRGSVTLHSKRSWFTDFESLKRVLFQVGRVYHTSPLKLGSFSGWWERGNQGLQWASIIAGFADGGPQRRNGGMWQSLRNRESPLLTASKRTGTSTNSRKEMDSIDNWNELEGRFFPRASRWKLTPWFQPRETKSWDPSSSIPGFPT